MLIRFPEKHFAEAVVQKVFCIKDILGNFVKFTGKHLCQSLFLNKVAGLMHVTLFKKKLAQMFSCGFCEISKNTFSYRTPPVATSDFDTLKLVVSPHTETGFSMPLNLPTKLLIEKIRRFHFLNFLILYEAGDN